MKETVITGRKVYVSKTLISLNSRIYLTPNGGDPYTMKRRGEKKDEEEIQIASPNK